jgi:hypothetical protein
MLNLESNSLVFTFNGAEKKMRFPTVREWGSYQREIEALKNKNDSIDVIIDFFVKLGLDKKSAELLENAHLEAIINELSGVKKK